MYAHIERHLGFIDGVLQAPEDGLMQIDLYWVNAGPGRAFQTFVTCGMSERSMNLTGGRCSCSPHAELLLRLPADWRFGPEITRNPKRRWPLDLLAHLTRYPRTYATHFGRGHTVPRTFPGCCSIVPSWPESPFRGIVLREPTWASQRFRHLRRGRNGRVDLLGVIPLHDDELHFAYGEGSATLFEHLDEGGVTDLLQPDRPNLFEPIH